MITIHPLAHWTTRIRNPIQAGLEEVACAIPNMSLYLGQGSSDPFICFPLFKCICESLGFQDLNS